MENCIFCKIANGEIPSATLYEDEDFRVILDLGPASKGHALILPKAHAANIYELPDETAGKAMILPNIWQPGSETDCTVTGLTLYRIMEKLPVRLYFIFICI